MNHHRTTPIPLITLALLSGFAALSLELLWARQLSLTFGSSHYAVTTTLAGFLIGLGVGSFFGGRLADLAKRPILWLAFAELALGLLGPLLTVALIRLPHFAAWLLPEVSITHPGAVLSRFILALIVMLPGTLLMGATFPLMVRSVVGDVSSLHRSLPVLYGINTLGGVFGAVFSSFLLLPRVGVLGVTAAAAVFNIAASAVGFWSSRHGKIQESSPKEHDSSPVGSGGWLFLVLAGFSGGAVLAGETLWNRILGIVLPNSTLTFSILLALYLSGLAIGGLGASRLVARRDHLRTWAFLQAGAGAWFLAGIVFLPRISLWVRHIRPPDGWGRVLMTPLAVGGSLILPAVVLLGAAWPLLLAAGTPKVADGGHRIGLMGMTNAIGAGLGGAVAGWLIVPSMGIGRSLIALAAFHALLAAFAFLNTSRSRSFTFLAAGTVLLFGLALLLPHFGRIALPSAVEGEDDWRTIFYREGPTGTVSVLEKPHTTQRSMFVDNSAVIGTTYDALKVVRMLGLLPTLLHGNPDEVLVIGYGAGVTTSILDSSPAVKSIEVREIVPGVVEASPLFKAVNHNVLQSPKMRIGYGDGRNFLLLTDKQWDAITCDPVHPLYGSASLYSLEFFELCRQRLKKGGQMYQYLPLHHMPPTAFRQTIGTFSAVFPHTRVAFSLGHGVLIGSDQPIDLDWTIWTDRLGEFEQPSDLIDAVLQTPAQIAALMQLDTEGCHAVGLSPFSSDLFPILEFLEPEAFASGVWKANARTLIETYRSPLDEIEHLPRHLLPEIRRLIAGKRLLLFSQLEWTEGHWREAESWLRKALTVAHDDPEITRFAQQAQREGWLR